MRYFLFVLHMQFAWPFWQPFSAGKSPRPPHRAHSAQTSWQIFDLILGGRFLRQHFSSGLVAATMFACHSSSSSSRRNHLVSPHTLQQSPRPLLCQATVSHSARAVGLLLIWSSAKKRWQRSSVISFAPQLFLLSPLFLYHTLP